MRNPENNIPGEFLFLGDADNGIFYIGFALIISDGLFRRPKQISIPSIGIGPMNSFHPETIWQNCRSFNWFAILVLNHNQHFFELD